MRGQIRGSDQRIRSEGQMRGSDEGVRSEAYSNHSNQVLATAYVNGG